MKRVVVTGMGSVSPYGFGVECLWNSLLEGKNAISHIKNLKLKGDIISIGTCLPEYKRKFILEQYSYEPQRDEEKCFFEAVREAMTQADLRSMKVEDTYRVLVSIADRKPSLIHFLDKMIREYGSRTIEDSDNNYYQYLCNQINPCIIGDMEGINHYTSRAYGIRGPQLSIATACASGNNAIGESFQKIRSGMIDVAITGGAYSLDLNSMIGFSRLGALTTNPDPDLACRPFDKQRNGFVMGSGCGILVLEEYEHAINRGATIYGEIVGYATNSDAYRATDSDPLATAASKVIKDAISMAGIKKEEIGYINAHGTSTVMNDYMETVAIKNVFGDYAYKIPISSTTSMIGHSIMAAAAREAIVCIKSLEMNIIHGTRNYHQRDEELDLDYVPEKQRKMEAKYALSNSFGFGGQNSSVIFARCEI